MPAPASTQSSQAVETDGTGNISLPQRHRSYDLGVTGVFVSLPYHGRSCCWPGPGVFQHLAQFKVDPDNHFAPSANRKEDVNTIYQAWTILHLVAVRAMAPPAMAHPAWVYPWLLRDKCPLVNEPRSEQGL